MTNYGRYEFWEDRYQKDAEQFDWLQRYVPPSGNNTMKEIIAQYSQPNSQILIVGCGTSRMPEEMHEDGYQHITCVDYSYSAIKL